MTALSLDEKHLERAPWAPITVKHYRAALRLLSQWIDETGRAPDQLTDADLATWVRERSTGHNQTAITLAAVSAAYSVRQLVAPVGKITRFEALKQAKAAPPPRMQEIFSPDDLGRLVGMAPPDVASAAVIAWHGALRIGEVESLAVPGSHASIETWRKGIRYRALRLCVVGKRGPREVRVREGDDPDYCPVEWYQVSPPDGRWHSIRERLVRWMKRSGIGTQTHGFRRGWATEAARNGLNAQLITRYLGHDDPRAALVYVGNVALEDIPALI